MRKKNIHPVWQVYNLLRTASLNYKYYLRRLRRVRQINIWIDASIAIVTSSVVAAWVAELAGLFEGQQRIGLIWKITTGFAAVVSIVKPFLRLPEKIEALQAHATTYSGILAQLRSLSSRIHSEQDYAPEHKSQFYAILRDYESVDGALPPEEKPNMKLKEECESEVLKEYPMSVFFDPSRLA